MLRRSFVQEFINLTGEYVWVGWGREALDRYFGGFFIFNLSIFQFFNSALWSSVLFPPPSPSPKTKEPFPWEMSKQ